MKSRSSTGKIVPQLTNSDELSVIKHQEQVEKGSGERCVCVGNLKW